MGWDSASVAAAGSRSRRIRKVDHPTKTAASMGVRALHSVNAGRSRCRSGDSVSPAPTPNAGPRSGPGHEQSGRYACAAVRPGRQRRDNVAPDRVEMQRVDAILAAENVEVDRLPLHTLGDLGPCPSSAPMATRHTLTLVGPKCYRNPLHSPVSMATRLASSRWPVAAADPRFVRGDRAGLPLARPTGGHAVGRRGAARQDDPPPRLLAHRRHLRLTSPPRACTPMTSSG